MAGSYSIKHRDEFESMEGSGGSTWRLARKALGASAFGFNLVEIEPGGQIPEHDEADRDQEEVFYMLTGEPTLVIDGEEHPTRAGTFARLDPMHRRTVRNDGGEPASVLIVSAPCSSGYEPMEWA